MGRCDDPLVAEKWQEMRLASTGLVEVIDAVDVVELYCTRCRAFQCHMTKEALLVAGVYLRRPTILKCRSCGRDWKYSPADPPVMPRPETRR